MPAVLHQAEVVGEQCAAIFRLKQLLAFRRKGFARLSLQLGLKRFLSVRREYVAKGEFLPGFPVKSADMDDRVPVCAACVCPILASVACVLGINEHDLVFD